MLTPKHKCQNTGMSDSTRAQRDKKGALETFRGGVVGKVQRPGMSGKASELNGKTKEKYSPTTVMRA